MPWGSRYAKADNLDLEYAAYGGEAEILSNEIQTKCDIDGLTTHDNLEPRRQRCE